MHLRDGAEAITANTRGAMVANTRGASTPAGSGAGTVITPREQPATPRLNYQDALKDVVTQYNKRIDELAKLTAELPQRLHVNCSPPPQSSRDFDASPRCSDASPRSDHRIATSEKLGSRVWDEVNPLAQHIVTDLDEEIAKTKKRSSRFGTDLSASSSIDNMSQCSVHSHTFLLMDAWKMTIEGKTFSLAQGSVTRSVRIAGEIALSELPEGDYTLAEKLHGCPSYFVSSPTNPTRIIWELCGMALVLYDLIVIPLALVFNPPRSGILDVLDWGVLIFWTLNVPVLLTTGYIVDGILILNLRSIFMNYAKTWLVIDLVTIPPDWVLMVVRVIQESEQGAGSVVRLVRMLRFMRFARLARLSRLRNAVNVFYDMIDSEKIGIVFEISKMISVLMLVTHYIACIWFCVGFEQKGDGWVEYYQYTNADWELQYLVAYHWSITQFTPASMDVHPRTKVERAVAIITVLFALVGFSYLVGSITGSLARLRAMGERKSNSFWILRKFLRRRSVPHDLSVRIKTYCESRWDHQQNHMKPSSVEALDLLSDHLKSELEFALHGPALCIHPLFVAYKLHSTVTMRRLTARAVSSLSLAPHDLMFVAGEGATHMSIVTAGMLEYRRNVQPEPEIVQYGEDWVAEPVLWARTWTHLGDLQATVSTELLRVSPDVFQDIVALNPFAYTMAQKYAKRYLDWLNGFSHLQLSDITQGEDRTVELAQFVTMDHHNGEDEDAVTRAPSRVSRQGSRHSVNSSNASIPVIMQQVNAAKHYHRHDLVPVGRMVTPEF